jgi:hypothetical protein
MKANENEERKRNNGSEKRNMKTENISRSMAMKALMKAIINGNTASM